MNPRWDESEGGIACSFPEIFLNDKRSEKGLRIGDKHRVFPCWISISNMEIEGSDPDDGFLRGLGMASWTNGFVCSVSEGHLTGSRYGNHWLRWPVRMSASGYMADNEALLVRTLTLSRVGAIELYLDRDGEISAGWQDDLLESMDRVRSVAGGKPVGLRLEREVDIKEFIGRFRGEDKTPDFITFVLNSEKEFGLSRLCRQLSRMSRALEQTGLRDRVSLLVSHRGLAGRRLIKMLQYGADAFMERIHIVKSGMHDDPDRSSFSELVYAHRRRVNDFREVESRDPDIVSMEVVPGKSASRSDMAGVPIGTNYRNILKDFIYHFN